MIACLISLLFSPAKAAIGKWARQGGRRFVLKNICQGLDKRGEWYCDEKRMQAELIPPLSFFKNNSELSQQILPSYKEGVYAVAPLLDCIISICDGASNVKLLDLEIRHSSNGKTRTDEYFASHGAIEVQDSQKISIQRVHVAGVAGSGILVQRNVTEIIIQDSAIELTGGDRISFGDASSSHIVIKNNYINDTAQVCSS